jgi:hypothetical protein
MNESTKLDSQAVVRMRDHYPISNVLYIQITGKPGATANMSYLFMNENWTEVGACMS